MVAANDTTHVVDCELRTIVWTEIETLLNQLMQYCRIEETAKGAVCSHTSSGQFESWIFVDFWVIYVRYFQRVIKNSGVWPASVGPNARAFKLSS